MNWSSGESIAITSTFLLAAVLIAPLSDEGWIAEIEKPVRPCESRVFTIESCWLMSIVVGSWKTAFTPSSCLAFDTPACAAVQ